MSMIEIAIGLGIALAVVILYLLNSTIIFPLPLELLAPFLKHGGDGLSFAAPTNGKVENASLAVKDQSQAEKPTASGATPAMVGGNGR
jgi:hypothetical protein